MIIMLDPARANDLERKSNPTHRVNGRKRLFQAYSIATKRRLIPWSSGPIAGVVGNAERDPDESAKDHAELSKSALHAVQV